MSARAQGRVQIHAPLESVYALVRNPRLVHTWQVGIIEADRVDGTGARGTHVRTSYLVSDALYPLGLTVVEDTLELGRARWVADVIGPMTGRQAITIVATAGAVDVSFEFEYTVPEGAVDIPADHQRFVDDMQDAVCRSLDNLRVICEAGRTLPSPAPGQPLAP